MLKPLGEKTSGDSLYGVLASKTYKHQKKRSRHEIKTYQVLSLDAKLSLNYFQRTFDYFDWEDNPIEIR